MTEHWGDAGNGYDLHGYDDRLTQLEAFAHRVDDGWVPFGWHIAYPGVRLEYDGVSACGDPVWERNVAWGLTPTEREADRNARGGS